MNVLLFFRELHKNWWHTDTIFGLGFIKKYKKQIAFTSSKNWLCPIYELDIGWLHYRTLFWFNQEQKWKLRVDMQRLFRIKVLHQSCNETSVVKSFHFIKRLDIVLASFLRLYTLSYAWFPYQHFGFIIFTKMKWRSKRWSLLFEMCVF